MDWKAVIRAMRVREDFLAARTQEAGSPVMQPIDRTAARVLKGIADALEAGLEEE